MDVFTDEEFNVFCEELEKELENLEKIENGDFDNLSELKNEELKNVFNEILKIYETQDESKETEMLQKYYMVIRNLLSIDKMTDNQFEKFLSNQIFLSKFEQCYVTEVNEEFDKLPDSKKSLYSEKEQLQWIRAAIREASGEFSFQGSWGNFSENIQIKYFQELMELCKDVKTKIVMWKFSKEETQQQNIDTFKNLLEECKNDFNVQRALWKDTIPEIQKFNFEEILGNFEENYKSKLELWKGTHPEVQKENLENLLENFNGNFSKQIEILKATNPEAQKEKEEFIFKFINSLKSKILKQNEELRQQLQESKEYEEKKRINNLINVNCIDLKNVFASISAELQNSEKGKEFFYEIWDNVEHHDLIMLSSEEFIKQNFCGIINKLIEDDDYSYWPIFNLEKKVSDETLIEKDNFESLNKYYTKGKPFDEKKYEKIKELFKLNNNIVRTIDFDFLANEDILTNYTDEQLLRITNYPEIQYYLHEYCCKNGGNMALKESINYLLSNDNNWVISLDTILNNISGKNCEKKQYDELIKNISQVDENDITDDFKQQLLSILSERENYFDIKNYEDVCNYTNIRNEVCEKIFNGNFEDIPETLKERYKGNRDNLYKFALLEHQFGISIETAYGLVSKYGKDAKEFPNGEIKDYLLLLDEIINCRNIEEIIKEVNIKVQNGEIEPWLESVDSRNVESQIYNTFEDMYNDVLYNPQKEEKARTEIYLDKHGKEHEIDIYELDKDFCMLFRVEGAFLSETKDVEDYVEYYDVPDIHYHGNCMSFIRQDSISYVGASNSLFVGYSGIRKNQLQMMGPHDLCSENVDFNNYDGLSRDPGGGGSSSWSEFRSPNQLINHTRQRYNEVVTERFIYDENGNVVKSKPDFVIAFGNSNTKIPDEEKRIAVQLGVPLVLIDREKIVQKEYSRIEVMKKLIAGEEIVEPEYQQYFEEYKNLSMPELIEQIIIKFENNRTGIQFNTELRKKYFSIEQFQSIVNVIEKSIDKISESSLDIETECLKAFDKVCWKELLEQDSSNDTLKNTELKKEYEVKKELFESIRNKIASKSKPISKEEYGKSSKKVNTLLQQYLDQGIDVNSVTSVVGENAKENQKENDDKNNVLHNQYGD